MRAESIRSEVVRMVRRAPFQPFNLSRESGDRIPIGHPENIAFDPDSKSSDFYVTSGSFRYFGTFEAVSGVATAAAAADID
jgi:hypothetical protein